MHFFSLRGYGLNYSTIFGVAGALFLGETPTWVYFDSCKSKISGKIHIIIGIKHLSTDFCFWTSYFDDFPVSLGKRFIPQKKAQYTIKQINFQNCKDFHHEIR